MPNQLPPMGYQVFALPPQQPLIWPPIAQHQGFALPPQQPQAALENRVDYTARLMENFNSTHQSRCNRCSSHWSSVVQSIDAQAEAANIENRKQLQLQALSQQVELQRQDMQ